MPYFNYEEFEYKDVLNEILDEKDVPVARCRLLSKGFEPYHRLSLDDPLLVEGDKGCLACGNCIDSCPVLRKEPERLDDTTVQRTSMALESTVGEDCEQCYSCILACPQVDTSLKDYTVDTRVPEVIPPARALGILDKYLMAVVALVFGILLGVFIDISALIF